MLAALLALLALATPPDAALSVRGGRFHGSALVWDAPRGRLLTALHVVEEMPEVRVALAGGEVAARIVDRDPWLDLALLEVDVPLPAALPLAARPPAPGARVTLAGCPALRCGAVDAEVLAPLRAFAGARYVELAGEARPGASGGPVLDADGAVVGVVDLALRGGVALAVPIERAAARFPRAPAAVAAVALHSP